MKTLASIKNRLIDRIMVTNNEQLLNALETIFSSTKIEDKLILDSHQIEMLIMSDNDIQQENLISESELSKEDPKWMD